MKIGIAIEDIWDFFNEIYEDLDTHHSVSLFKRRSFHLPLLNARINRILLRNDLKTFMQLNKAIFFEWASELLVVASNLPKSCGLITRMHRYDMYRWIDQVNWDALDKIILVSQAKKIEFSRKMPDQAHKIVVIPEAISFKKFKNARKSFNGNIGILCHLKPRKRVYDLVLTFYEMTKLRDGLHLHVGGDMRLGHVDYYEALQHLVKELNLTKKVTFDGHVTNPAEWYQKIDIFISNSFSEGLQVSPMESIASGCYCLSHFWDGADELLPPDYLFYSGTEMIEKVFHICDSSEAKRAQEKETQKDWVRENFDIQKTKVQIRELVEEVGRTW